MLRILVANMPAYGVANPSLPLVRELVAAGHLVDYLLAEAFRGAVVSFAFDALCRLRNGEVHHKIKYFIDAKQSLLCN